MAVTTHLGGYPAVGRMLWRRDPQHQPTPKGQGLGDRMRTRKRLQLGAFLIPSTLPGVQTVLAWEQSLV